MRLGERFQENCEKRDVVEVDFKQIAIQMILSLPDQKICADSESENFAALALS